MEDNLIILKKLSEFKSFGVPVLLGASRKSFIGKIYASGPEERIEGSLAATALAFENIIDFIRVHDVKAHKNMLEVLKAVRNTK